MRGNGPSVRFWGTRGSTPSPQSSHMIHGGNTACVEFRTGDSECIVFDAGTGIVQLGRQLMDAGEMGAIHIFLSHFHWDHIQGLPFFAPLYKPGAEIRFYAAERADEIRERLAGQMTWPYFPVEFGSVAANVEFIEMSTGPVRIQSTTVRAFPLNHPQGSNGYRAEIDGRVIVYATDHEEGSVVTELSDEARGAQLLVMDAQYTVEESKLFTGRGHSSWLAAVQVARAARVSQLVLFHHDPHHDDTEIAQMEEQARELFTNTVAAREGLVMELGLAGKAAVHKHT